jgi:hypothetical protein
MKSSPESPLQLLLVRQLLNDKNFTLRARSVDKTWNYKGTVETAMTGFNQFTSDIYYGGISALSSWLESPEDSARPYNERDLLMRELLLACHDYYHVWSTHLIQTIAPELEFDLSNPAAIDIERHTFCHLLTEAAATIAIDYWFLARIDVNSILPIGTKISSLTTNYHHKIERELSIFNNSFATYDPSFFVNLASFYCTGNFIGFSVDELKVSPVLLNWLEHELRYGAVQRSLAREWFAYIADTRSHLVPKAPLHITEPWQSELMEKIAEYLWRKVTRDDDVLTSSDVAVVKKPVRFDTSTDRIDLRFVNILSVERHRWLHIANLTDSNRDYFKKQILSSVKLAKISKTDMDYIVGMFGRNELGKAMERVEGVETISSSEEPVLVFLPN